jgi:hypothetical protein
LDGRWYGAVICEVLCDGRYVVDWDDGDVEDRVKGRRELRAGKREVGREGKGDAKGGGGGRSREESEGDRGGGEGEVVGGEGEVVGGEGDGGGVVCKDACFVCKRARKTYSLFPCGHKVGVCFFGGVEEWIVL